MKCELRCYLPVIDIQIKSSPCLGLADAVGEILFLVPPGSFHAAVAVAFIGQLERFVQTQ